MDGSQLTKKGLLLSAQRIAAAVERVTDKDVWLSDNTGLRGMGRLVIRISPTGGSRFYFRYAKDGKRDSTPLGPYSRTARDGYFTLGQARTAAQHLSVPLLHVVNGQPPLQSRRATPLPLSNPSDAEQAPGDGLTLIELCRLYVANLMRKRRASAKQSGKDLERTIAPLDIATVLARDITPEQIVGVLRTHIELGHIHTAQRLRSLLHAAYQASLNAPLDPGASPQLIDPLLKTNPLANIRTLSGANVARSRFLDKAELSDFWRRLTNMSNDGEAPVAVRALRLTILLGGQRCEQLLRVRVEQVDLEAESILLLDPKGRREVPRNHHLPLLNEALEEAQWLVQNAKHAGSTYLFPSERTDNALRPSAVSRLVTRIRKDMVSSGTAKRQFQFSDLRRTAETHLAELGVSKDHRAQLQSHGLSGIQERHYDRYEYMREKRAALLKWHEYLNSMLPGNS